MLILNQGFEQILVLDDKACDLNTRDGFSKAHFSIKLFLNCLTRERISCDMCTDPNSGKGRFNILQEPRA